MIHASTCCLRSDCIACCVLLRCRCDLRCETILLEQINIESLDKLREIHRCYRAADSMIDGSAGQSLEWVSVVDWSGLEAMLAEAELAINASDGRAEKHALVLQTTQQYCVRLGAARVTCCKSGKDRTGMVSMQLQRAARQRCRAVVDFLTRPKRAPSCISPRSQRMFGAKSLNFFCCDALQCGCGVYLPVVDA